MSLKKYFNTKSIFFASLALGLALFLPSSFANASWYNPVTWTEKLGEILVGFFLQITLLVANSFLALGNGLLAWVIGNPFNLSYTDPARNQIIAIGWTVTRDLTNMFFILGLIYVAIATALRFNSFKTGKIFFKLILIAILINFSPLICGIIVDTANIFTNYFLNGVVGFDAFQQVFKMQASNFKEMLLGPPSFTPIIKTIVLSLYGFGAGFILLIFFLIFFVRYFAIWVLVILSPLAFFFWIFPQTESYFKKWADQCLKWSFIAIPIAFFLYLAQQFLAFADKQNLFASSSGLSGNISFMTPLLPYIGSLIFLGIGLYLSSQLNVAGVNLLMKAGKIGAVALSGGAAVAALGYASNVATSARAGAQALGSKRKRTISKLAYGALGAISGGAAGMGKGLFAGVKEGARTSGEKAFPYLTRKGIKKAAQKSISKHKEKLTGLETDHLKRIVEKSYNPREKAAAIEYLGEKGGFDYEGPEAGDRIRTASMMGADLSALAQSRPEFAPYVNYKKTDSLTEEFRKQGMSDNEARKKAERKMIEEQLSSMSPEDVRKKIHPKSLNNVDVLSAMNARAIGEIVKKGTQKQVEALKQIKTPGTRISSEVQKELEAADKGRKEKITDIIRAIKNNPLA